MFAATPWECRAIVRALPGCRVERVGGVTWRVWEHPACMVAVIMTGVGPGNAMAVCRAVVEQRPWTLCLASGYAGALVPARVGDLVIPARAIGYAPDGAAGARSAASAAPDSTVVCDAFYRQTAWDVAQSAGCAALDGDIVTAPAAVSPARDKQAMGRALGASGVDMESAAVGMAAARGGVPFCVVRAVLDLAEEDLPHDLTLLCRPATWLRGAWGVVAAPRVWPALNRLRRQKNTASAALTRFFEAFFRQLAGASVASR